jgi:hypothetical protein
MAADPKNDNKGRWTVGPACKQCGQSTIVFCCFAAPAPRRRRTLICDHCRVDAERKTPLRAIVHPN